MTSGLPDGVRADELAGSTTPPAPHLTQSPRSMSSEEVEQEEGDVSHTGPEGGGLSSGTPLVSRGRSTTIRTEPGSPNARSKSITVADGNDTQGCINRHPATSATFTVGVASDKNEKCRRTMEDSHAFMYDFGNVPGQGYFAVFDGHAGKHAAEWCGEHFHEYLLSSLEKQQGTPIPDVLNSTFHSVDSELSAMASKNGTHSGCTAVTAFLRVEDAQGNAVPVSSLPTSPLQQSTSVDQQQSPSKANHHHSSSSSSSHSNNNNNNSNNNGDQQQSPATSSREKRRSSGVTSSSREKLMQFITRGTRSRRSSASERPPSPPRRTASSEKEAALSKNGLKRVLYTANVGDARAVLCRGGRAVRLTYDHKGADNQEAKRITDAGGFVMNNRVNGILAVTRSLGDSSMKDFVVGSPYTTETTIGPDDDWLVVACDGLWDVCDDQEVCDLLIKEKVDDAQDAAQMLLEVALGRFSSDNVSVLAIKL